MSEPIAPTRGTRVKLIEAPDGCLSRHYPVTVGAVYEVVGHMGSCLIVTTDQAEETASIWRGRFTTRLND